MLFELRFKKSVQKDLKRIGQDAAKKVMLAIRETLLTNPHAGKQLRGEFSDLWSFRAGSYWVIYTFSKAELWILIVQIGHRKDVYKKLS